MSFKKTESENKTDLFAKIEQDLSMEITNFPEDIRKRIKGNLFQTKNILDFLQSGKSNDLPEYFDLSNDPDDVDQGHLARLFLQYPDAQNMQFVMSTAYIMRMLYNQAKLSHKSLSQMQTEHLDTYKYIAPKIFGNPNIAEGNYTDNHQAKDQLVKQLKSLKLDKNSTIGLPSVGQGLTELAALEELGNPLDNIFANDILPFTSLYPEFAHHNLEDLRAHNHLSWFDARKFCKLHPTQFNAVISMGSSFNNSENIADPLEIFMAINESLLSGGMCIYESRNIDQSTNNSIRVLTDQYLARHRARAPGTKPPHPDYLRPYQNLDSFGAMLHSDFFVQSLAKLAGFELMQNPGEQVWSPKDGIYRSIYLLKKTGSPHPLAMQILKSFQSAFAHRFPEDADRPSPVS